MDKLTETSTPGTTCDPTSSNNYRTLPTENLAQQRGTHNAASDTPWLLHVCPTTGGQFDIPVSAEDTVEHVKKCISKRLQISQERISLLFKERVLKDGTLSHNGISEGGKITLLPNVESGLMSQRQENSVLQALENLTEPQVNDFLAGKSPLTLAMRLGDHMMFVQLQLSTSQASSKRTTTNSSSSKHRSLKHHHHHSGAAAASSRHLNHHHPPPSSQSKTVAPSASAAAAPGGLTPHGGATGLPTTQVMTPIPVHAQQPHASTSHTSSAQAQNIASCITPSLPARPSTSGAGGSTPKPCDTAAAPQPTPSTSGLVAPKRAKLDGVPVLDSTALAEASRNLSQKLKELSAASSSHIKAPADVKQEKKVKKVEPVKGAIIESMQHHGQGVYSGTFSGTLNPALQDRNGKPKKSVSTIIHILNDLLGASPQYRAQMVRQQRHEKHAERLARAAHRNASRSSEQQIRRQENRATRGKMEQLQMMMRERHERRKARREARAAPYSTGHAAWSASRATGHTAQMSTAHNNKTSPRLQEGEPPMEVDANVEAASNVADNVTESSGYTQMKTTEPVVA